MHCLPECDNVSFSPKQTDVCETSGLDPTVLRGLQAGLVAAERVPSGGRNWHLAGFCLWTDGLQTDLQRRLEKRLGVHSYLFHKCLLSVTHLVLQVLLRVLIS